MERKLLVKVVLVSAVSVVLTLLVIVGVAWAADIFTVDKDGTVRLVITDTGKVGIGTINPTKTLDVNGTLGAIALSGTWDSSSSNYVRLGDMQIAWGTINVGAGQIWNNATTHSWVLVSQTVTFPAAFSSTPKVTISCRDGQISARSAYVSFFNSLTTGISDIYLTSPNNAHGNTTLVELHWIAVGKWQ